MLQLWEVPAFKDVEGRRAARDEEERPHQRVRQLRPPLRPETILLRQRVR